jgi:hypothetical protein
VVYFVNMINRRRNKGVEDWRAHHHAYIALWDPKGSSRQHYLHGARHRSEPWVEYLRWLHKQSRLFLRPAYTQVDIAELPDSDDDNELANVYNEMTRGGTVELERGPFQNYVVSIFWTYNMYGFSGAVVRNCDYCCTGDATWMVSKRGH